MINPTPKIVYKLGWKEFTIVPEGFKEIREYFEVDEDTVKIIESGQIKTNMRGFYFKAEISYDKITAEEYLKLVVLFNRNISEIRYYPNKDGHVYYKVKIAEPLKIIPAWRLAFKNFTIVFESIERYDIAYLEGAEYWGTRMTTFADRTSYNGLTWNDVMIELNLKDESLNANIGNLNNLFESHRANPIRHERKYISKKDGYSALAGLRTICIQFASNNEHPVPVSGVYSVNGNYFIFPSDGYISDVLVCSATGNVYLFNYNLPIEVKAKDTMRLYYRYFGPANSFSLEINLNNELVWSSLPNVDSYNTIISLGYKIK